MDFDRRGARGRHAGGGDALSAALDELPDHTDQLFVVDRDQVLKGTLPLARLIVSDLEREVRQVMVAERVKLYPQDRAEDAASAFERYDLVSAPVVDASERLIGRLTVNAVVDYIRERSAESQLAEAGLRAGGGRLRAGARQLQEPLGVARDQPGHRVHRLARHRRVRGLDRRSS